MISRFVRVGTGRYMGGWGAMVGLRLERGSRALLMSQVLFLLLRLKFIRDGRTVVMSTQCLDWQSTLLLTGLSAHHLPHVLLFWRSSLISDLRPSIHFFGSRSLHFYWPFCTLLFCPSISYFSFYVIVRWCVCIHLLPLGLAFVINLTIL